MPKKYQPVGVGMTPSRTELGKFIRECRIKLDLRQVPVSRAAKLSKGNNVLSAIETGQKKYLNQEQVNELAKVLQVDPVQLRKRMPEKHVAKPTTVLGKLIKARREELGMTLENFARMMEITPQEAKQLENRKSPSLGYPLAEPLAKVLKLNLSTFAKFVGREGKVTGSELGQMIRQRRKELAMSLDVLANKLHVSRQFVDQIESGKCRLSKNDERIKQLAEVLKLDVAQLNAIRPRRRLKMRGAAPSPLSGFLTDRRLELGLTQREVSDRAETTPATICSIETGRVHPTPDLLEKLEKALGCKIPPQLVPEKKKIGEHVRSTIVVWGAALEDLDKIKKLAGVKNNSMIVRKAIQLLYVLLERQKDNYVVSAVKGKDVVEFEILL